jgi:glycosyltransferase involved in cell wall biosynthesis
VEFGTTAVIASSMLQEQNKPFYVAVHGYDITTEFKDEAYQAQFIDLANHHQCKAIVCASHYTRRLCILAGVQAEKCKVVRLSIDGERIKRNGDIKKTQQPSFVHFGRLTEKKHPIATFEAFRKVTQSIPNASLTFIGDGPLRSELERRIAESGLDEKVQCLGVMEQSEALKEVQRHWVFVQHSVTAKSGDQEGFALSPAEAALMEMPVVSTLHNGIPEHVIDGETGYLVNEFDYETMAERMIQLAKNSDLRIEMGEAGRANVRVLCNLENRVQALRALFA